MSLVNYHTNFIVLKPILHGPISYSFNARWVIKTNLFKYVLTALYIVPQFHINSNRVTLYQCTLRSKKTTTKSTKKYVKRRKNVSCYYWKSHLQLSMLAWRAMNGRLCLYLFQLQRNPRPLPDAWQLPVNSISNVPKQEINSKSLNLTYFQVRIIQKQRKRSQNRSDNKPHIHPGASGYNPFLLFPPNTQILGFNR